MAKQSLQKSSITDVRLGSEYASEDKVYRWEISKKLGNSSLCYEKYQSEISFFFSFYENVLIGKLSSR